MRGVQVRKKDATRERDLTQGSMMSHYKALALPASVGMLFNTLYNIVDSYFAGMISTTAQAGLSLSFPLFLLVLAFSIGSSQALGGLVGRAKGRGDQVAARRIAAQGLGTVFIVSFAVSGLGVFFTPDLLKVIGGRGDWLAPAVDYATVIFLFAPAFLLAFGATGLLSAQGDQVSGKQAGIAAFFANCLLNPALIYGFAGLPALGFTGIAVSTVVTQCATACFLLYRVVQSSVLSGVQLRDFLPSRDIMLSVCTQGLPPALNFMTTAAAFFIWQSWLQPLGAQTVAAYGIALRVEQLALLPGIGLTLAMMPILSQNFGAERFDRLRYGFWWGLCVGLTYMGGVGLVLWVGGGLILSFFTTDAAVLAVGQRYLIYAAVTQPIYMGILAIQTLMQAVGQPGLSILTGLFRHVVAAIFWTVLFVRVLDWGAEGVWISVFLSASCGLILSLIFLRLVVRKTVRFIGSPVQVFKRYPVAER